MRVDDGLRALLRRRLPPPGQFTTVETGGRGDDGVPDCYWIGCGIGVWIECKSARRGRAVSFRPGQLGWLLTYCRHGGRAVVAVRRRLIRDPGVDELHLLAGADAEKLGSLGLPLAPWDDPPARQGVRRLAPAPRPLGQWRGGPARWDWDEIRTALLT